MVQNIILLRSASFTQTFILSYDSVLLGCEPVQFGRYLPAIRRNLVLPSVGYKILLSYYVTPCSLVDRYQTVEGTCCVASQCRRLRLCHTGTWRPVVWYTGTTVLEETGGNRCLLRHLGRTACQWDCCYSKDVNRHLPETQQRTTRCHTQDGGIFNIHCHKNLVAHLRQSVRDFSTLTSPVAMYHPITGHSTSDGHSSYKNW